jgi:hypothetical protein
LVPASILQGCGAALMWNAVSTYVTSWGQQMRSNFRQQLTTGKNRKIPQNIYQQYLQFVCHF